VLARRTWTYREVARDLRAAGCEPTRQRGSHERWECTGGCRGTLVAKGPGTVQSLTVLRGLTRQLHECIGDRDWMP
jgi:predicted RNA binding protein YcfA (HicA-like mRNA interferase family)